jgi:hypothetical protein
MLKRMIEFYGVSTAHFDPNWTRRSSWRHQPTPLEEVLVENSSYKRTKLKVRLYEAGLKRRACEMCGQGETWNGRQMSLILDHINGVWNDNRLENLRIVCPNCNATLDTHCGRQNRQPVDPRECLHCGAEFMPRYPSQRYCSQPCGVHSPGPRSPRPSSRRVERPSHEQLKTDLRASNYSAVGRKYGVSDNAVRKWMRWYERAREEASRGQPEPAAAAADPAR